MRYTPASLCAALTLTLIACGGAKPAQDPPPAEALAQAPVEAPAADQTDAINHYQAMIQGQWGGPIFTPGSEDTPVVSVTIEGTHMAARDVDGGTAVTNRDHDMMLGIGPDGSSLTIDLPHADSGLVELCAAEVSPQTLMLCCNRGDDEGQITRPSDARHCKAPGDYSFLLARP